MTVFPALASAEFGLLDCTLRDGGYCNDWLFDQALAPKLAAADIKAGVLYCELGFRSPVNDSYKGPFYFSDDGFLRAMNLPMGIKYLVMMNISEYLTTDNSLDSDLLFDNFGPADISPIDGVRVACRLDSLDQALEASKALKSLGYLVMINLMQINVLDEAQIKYFGGKIDPTDVDVVYLADSTGSESPESIRNKISILGKSWSGQIGFHAHDNLGLAMANANAAVQAGAALIDATALGMGRGPGNLRLEEVLIYKKQISSMDCLDELIELTESHFQKLKAQHNWGYSPLYVLSGLLGVHPTYAQEILNQKSISNFEGLAAIESISKQGMDKYNPKRMIEATEWYSQPVYGDEYPNYLRMESILLLGPCPISREVESALRVICQKNKLLVVALNNSQPNLDDIIGTRFYSDPISIQRNLTPFLKTQSIKVLPFSALPAKLQQQMMNAKKNSILNFGLELSETGFKLFENRVAVKKSLALHYALGILSGAQVPNLFIAGFDGYSPLDPRQNDSIEAFRAFEAEAKIKILSLTPTTYDLATISPFGPVLRS